MKSLIKKIKKNGDKAERSQNAIEINNVSKSFFVPTKKKDTLVDYLKHPKNIFKKKSDGKLLVLDHVNFDVKKGEFLGIIGNNGSGKSTLLKLISGVYTPDRGEIIINGSLVPFLQLGVGFNPELSARDNIFLNGTILGMKKKEIEKEFAEIIKFAELERFIDLSLKNYSSGMRVRLAFSIAIRSKADIYVLDEVIAVGDANFHEKSFREFERLRNQGKTIILVTHSLGVVRNFCDRTALIDQGKVAKIGDPDEVVDFYEDLNRQRLSNPNLVNNKKR
ncbi:ATP-binding cassette domain-containing protein [Candidatus Dojkabacteria bacterium]|nr:ATP-binding cassette domain-containing protein [Candidatus Dojkabacteria bacterium]